MAFELFEEEKPDVAEEKKPSMLRRGLDFAEGTAQSGVSAGTSALSSVVGFPGNILSFTNDYIAGPLTSLLTGKETIPYDQLSVSGYLPTSQTVEKKIHEAVPYTKPRSDFQKTTNDVVDTLTTLLLPGGQEQIGRYVGTSAPFRALAKSIGVEFVKKGAEDLSGDEQTGNYAKAGSLFLLSFLDRQNVGRYVSALYRTADRELATAGNPVVNAAGYRRDLEDLLHDVTSGANAGSETATARVVQDALAHFNGDDIHVENLVGIQRSVNEIRQGAMRTAASRAEGLRARQLLTRVSHGANEVIRDYGTTNARFWQPFSQAQEAFGTMARSNVISNWAQNNLSYVPSNGWLAHLFTGATSGVTGYALSGGAGGLSQSALLVPAGYQAMKFLYRVGRSPTLRRYYTQAARAAIREDAALFNRSVENMDKFIQKEDATKPPYEVLDDED